MVEFYAAGMKRDWEKDLQGLAPGLMTVRPDGSWASRDDVHQTAQRTIEFFNQDLAALHNDAAFIFSLTGNAQDLSRQNVNLLRRWHMAERSPSLASLAAFALEQLQPTLSPDIGQGIFVAAILGEVENNLPYHNNMHYKKVLLQVMRLIAVHNDIYHGTDQAFDGRQVGILLLAACIHDLGHDGKGNTIRGVFEAGRLERHAFELAQPYLEKCGMNNADLETIKVMLLCTDVSPLGDPANPINQMKSAYRYHFLGMKKKIGPLNLDPELAVLQKDADLTMMGIILHEADIGTSAGLDYNLTTFETSQFMKEMGEDQAYPEDVTGFLDDICQRQMLSDAAQKLYASNMARIYALAEKEIADGNHAYPQPEYSEFLSLHTADTLPGSGKTIN